MLDAFADEDALDEGLSRNVRPKVRGVPLLILNEESFLLETRFQYFIEESPNLLPNSLKGSTVESLH